MTRTIIIALLIIVATLFVFEVSDRDARAQVTGGNNQILENQKLILDKLAVMDRKLDQLKMRIR